MSRERETLAEEVPFVAPDDFIAEGDVVEGAPRPPASGASAMPPHETGVGAPPRKLTLAERFGPALRFGVPTLLVLALAATGTFAWLWQSAGAASGDRAALRVAGAKFSMAFLTLDSAHIDRTEAAVLKLSTGAFQRVYKQGLEAGVLSAVLSVAHATTTASVPDVYVGASDAKSATVITHALVNVTAYDGKGNAQPPRRVEFYIQLDLVKQSGRWLVDGVENLNFGAPAQPSSAPSP